MTTNARVTRQTVEALGGASGKVRVSRQFVEVLAIVPPVIVARQSVAVLGDAASAVDVDSTDTLSLTSQATLISIRLVSLADTLSLTHEVGADLIHPVADTLSLSHAADYDLELTPIVIAHSLTLTDEATVGLVVARQASDTLSLTHEAKPGAVLNVSAAHTISVTDTPTVEIIRRVVDTLSLTDTADSLVGNAKTVSDTLSLSHTATRELVANLSASHTLNLTHSVRAGHPINVLASDLLCETHWDYDPVTGTLIPYILGLQDAVELEADRQLPRGQVDNLPLWHRAFVEHVRADGTPAEASDTLSLTDAAYVNQTPLAAHTLALTQTAEVVASKAVADTLVLTDAATLNIVYTLSASDTLNLQQSVGWSRITLGIENIYSPFIGVGGTTPPATLDGPVAGIGACRFVWPPVSPSVNVPLRSPEFGNKQRLTCQRISRETRGGTLVTFADSIWPKLTTLVWTVTGLTRVRGDAVLAFFSSYLGLEVGLVDYEQRYWRGVVLTFDPLVEDSPGCFTVGFEFEGDLAEWET